MKKDLVKLQNAIGYHFNDEMLLKQALTHPSYSAEEGFQRYKSNQRLEFLGDAVLEMITSEFLYLEHPMEEEGELTKRRSSLVFESALALCAKNIDLGENIFLGVGETQFKGYEKPSILSDTFEALIGAIYLDGGIDKVRGFISKFVFQSIDELSLLDDSKSLVQKYVQNKGGSVLRYETLASDDEKSPRFRSKLFIDEKLISNGFGPSKKQAEQDAAKKACKKLDII